MPRGVKVDCSERDGGLECAILSDPLSPTAIWINQISRYKFPCPILSHDHEISACPDFLALSPKGRWCKTPRGRICFTCLRPKGPHGVCKVKKCTAEELVPLALICDACTPWAAAKGWAAVNILFCRKVEHGVGRRPIAVVRVALERYLGEIVIPNDKLRFSANLNYHASSGSEIIIPASIRTPSFDSEFGNKIDTSTVVVIPEVSEHSSCLMQWLRIGRKKCLILFDRGAKLMFT